MKKLLITLATVLSVVFLNSCRGPQVIPEGIPGPEGPAGGLEYATAIEIVTDFTPANNFRLEEPFGFEVFPADVPLIFIRWEQSGNGTDIWRPLPQTAYLDAGILSYNFDFTTDDFAIFLEGTFNNFADAGPDYLNNQIFRVVMVPAAFLETARAKKMTYDNITKELGITEQSFVHRDLR